MVHPRASRFITILLSACLCLGSLHASSIFAEDSTTTQAELSATETSGGISIRNEDISTANNKNVKFNNPITGDFFCADPTSVEYNGRLYLFGTNDHQQYEEKGADADNTYEKIKSIVILSTEDMVNWVYHGEINVAEVAPWITNSWAPSIASRVEADGLTHFYLYFSNNGLGVGVITATDPLGTWEDPLGKPLVSTSTPGLTNCPSPFDPGVVIDENGDGWLSFGGGKASGGTTVMPGSSRIVKLGDDMVSFASEFAEIPAPYFFEASELNYINGTYVYTYNTDWSDHAANWAYDCPAPSQCSMVYMTTKTPLDSDSWEMRGECFQNPGTSGFDYGNNHTHLQKYQGKYYIFYHTQMLRSSMGILGGYRSLGVDEINVTEDTVTIEKTGGTKKGADSIQSVDPFQDNDAVQLNHTADVSYDTSDRKNPIISSNNIGAWISVRDAEFTASEEVEEPEEPAEETITDINTITYDITVKSVDQDTTVSMHPATKSGDDCVGSVDVTKAGTYTIACDIGGTQKLQNMGYFTVSNDAQITFVIDSITVNDKYEFDLATELTNTREWADGLRNIWNGFADGDTVYAADNAVFRYMAGDDAIELFTTADTSISASAPLVQDPMTFYANVMGTGRIEVRLDSPTGELLSSVDFDSPDAYTTIYNSEVTQIGGTHDLYFVFSDENISLRSWKFAMTGTVVTTTSTVTSETTVTSQTQTETVVSTDASAVSSDLAETTTISQTVSTMDSVVSQTVTTSSSVVSQETEISSETSILYGDTNLDGRVDLTDAILLNKAVADSVTLNDKAHQNADCDANGEVGSQDAIILLRFLVHLVNTLPYSE